MKIPGENGGGIVSSASATFGFVDTAQNEIRFSEWLPWFRLVSFLASAQFSKPVRRTVVGIFFVGLDTKFDHR